MRPDNLTDRFNDLAVAAGVRPLGPQQVQHLIASNLLDAGYGIHEVANDSATTPRLSCATTPALTPLDACKPPARSPTW